jgi:hypothetical protein
VLQRDPETFKVIAAVWLGFQEGRLPLRGLVFVGGVWVYSVLVGLGHWHLYRVFRSPHEQE